MASAINMRSVALGQSQRFSTQTTSRGVRGLPSLRQPTKRVKHFKVSAQFEGRAQRAQEASTSSHDAFHNSAMLEMTSPANIMYTTQTRFTSLDRPALGTGQALGFVLAAAGLYIAMLVSAFAFGKSESKLAWRKRQFQNRARIPLRHFHTRRVAPRDGVKRPYVQHALQVSNLLLQSDPPLQLQRYPARVRCTAR